MYNNVAGFASTPTKNISFIPSVTIAPNERYGEIVNGKVKIRIYDFSKGKGQNAIESVVRLDAGVLPHLQNLCAASYFIGKDLRYPDSKYPESKIFGEPMASGPYQGLCQMTKLEFVWTESKKMWGISISNGFAQKVKTNTGGYKYASGSYKETKKGFFSLPAPKLAECLKNCADYFLLKKIEVGVMEHNLAEWEKKEKEERSAFRQNATAMPQQHQAAPPQNPPGAKNYRLMITSNFQKDQSGYYYCECSMNGRKFLLYFNKFPKSPFPMNQEITLPIIIIGDKCFWAA